jgi:hypothetical protein
VPDTFSMDYIMRKTQGVGVKKTIPSNTMDFLKYLKSIYEDKFEVEEKEVGTPSYWKKAGVIEMIRQVELKLKNLELKEI